MTPIRVDTARARRLLGDLVQLLAALPFWLPGFLAGLVVRVAVLLIAIAVFMFGAMLAGYEAGRGRRE